MARRPPQYPVHAAGRAAAAEQELGDVPGGVCHVGRPAAVAGLVELRPLRHRCSAAVQGAAEGHCILRHGLLAVLGCTEGYGGTAAAAAKQ